MQQQLRIVTDHSQDGFKVGKNLRLALDSLDESYIIYTLSTCRWLDDYIPIGLDREYLSISISFKKESEWVTVLNGIPKHSYIDKFTTEPIVTTSNSQCQSFLPTKFSSSISDYD